MALVRQCLRDQVRRTLAQRILAGEFTAGQRLIELHIAKELQVSQASVREALRELEAARLVESVPHRGTRVRMVSDRELAESYQVRGILERTAAWDSAPFFAGNAGTLRNLYLDLDAAAARDDRSDYAAANHAFHRLIVEKSGNTVLLRMWESLSFETRTLTRLHRPEANPALEAATHLPILEALEAGDGQMAGDLLYEHALSFPPKQPRT